MPAPQPRSSSLTHRHPAVAQPTSAPGPDDTPTSSPHRESQAPEPAQSSPQAPALQPPQDQPENTPQEDAAPSRSRGGRPRTMTVNGEVKRKTNFYITPSDKERAMRAQRIGSVYGEDMDTWTRFVERAVMELTKEVERKYNDSKPF